MGLSLPNIRPVDRLLEDFVEELQVPPGRYEQAERSYKWPACGCTGQNRLRVIAVPSGGTRLSYVHRGRERLRVKRAAAFA